MISSEKKLEQYKDIAFTGCSVAKFACDLSVVGKDIITTVMDGYSGSVAVRLWDGTLALGEYDAPCTIVFKTPSVLRELVLHRDLLRLADSYLAGDIELQGEMKCLFDLRLHLDQLELPLLTRLKLMSKAIHLPRNRKSHFTDKWRETFSRQNNSKASISHHYDVSNDFYRLWLDPDMVYSCAYFHDAHQPLADAQYSKLDILCKKLRLQPGQSLLDIGCGWGALAIHAARHYGVTVHGITLSEAQYKYAVEKVYREGLQQQVQIELLDYRDLHEGSQYDRIVSVGMFEHIGIKNFPVYFRKIKHILRPDGLFLNHGITSETGWERTPLTRFMNRYIFPDGELARISKVVEEMENAGFETLDVECLRRHYALTLRKWVANLLQHRVEAIRHSSETTFRLWYLYMAGCAYYFDEGSIGLHQILAGVRHQESNIPLCRDDIYIQ